MQGHLLALALPPQTPTGHLLDTSPPNRRIGWVAALAIFRTIGLRWWKRHLVQGFYRWCKAHIKISKGCPPSQMVRYKCVWTKDGEKPVYLWSSKERSAYKAQWGFLRSMADDLATV